MTFSTNKLCTVSTILKMSDNEVKRIFPAKATEKPDCPTSLRRTIHLLIG